MNTPERQAGLYRGTLTVRLDFQPAPKLPDALPHTGDPNAQVRQAIVQMIEDRCWYAPSLVLHQQSDLLCLQINPDVRCRAPGVTMDITEALLNKPKQRH